MSERDQESVSEQVTATTTVSKRILSTPESDSVEDQVSISP
jgi:hypothetical protein